MSRAPSRSIISVPGFWFGALVFAGVLLVRLVILLNLVSSSAFQLVSGDVAFYHQWALRILTGEWTDGHAFHALPLYAWWLAALYAICGVSAFAPALVQCLADAGTCLLICKTIEISARDWSPGWHWPSGKLAGLLGAFAWAFYLPAQTFAIVRMPTSLGTFVFWLVIWWVLRSTKPPALLVLGLLGLLIGFTAMAQATILFLVPLVLAALTWKRRPRNLLVACALLVCGLALGTAPAWVHNTFIARDPVFLSAHSGINFWIGNNPEATGYPTFGVIRAGQAEALEDSVTLAEAEAGRPLKRGEVSTYWSARARRHISNNFGDWLRLLGTKIWNFWNAFQYDDLSVISKLRELGVTFPGLSFGLIAATAIAGAPFVLLRSPPARWVFAGVLFQMIALLPVFITERYRLPAVPGLIIVSVLGILHFWRTSARLQFGPIASYCAVIAMAAFVVSWRQVDPRLWALAPYNAGREALETNDLAAAKRKLELAYAYVPQNAEINLALGNMWYARGDFAQSEQFYLRTLELDPKHKSAASNLGVVAMEKGESQRAAALFRRAIELSPKDAKAHYLLAQAAFALGDHRTAASEVEIAMRLRPGQREFEVLRDQLIASEAEIQPP